MYGLLTRAWWLVLLRGVGAAAFGATLLTWRTLPAGVLALTFGGFAVVDGTLGVVAAIGAGRRDARALTVDGSVGVITGIVALAWPAVTVITLLVLISTWAALRGAAELWAAWSLHRQCPNELSLAAAAVTVLVAAAVLGSHPADATAAVEQVTGVATVTAGALLVVLAVRLWSFLRASRRITDMALGSGVARGRHERAF